MIYVDMWHGDRASDADRIDVTFSDADCVYRGNIWINGRIVGDYTANTAQEIERRFPQLVFDWN